MEKNELFLTYKEADWVADLFKDAHPGSFEWSIYDLTRKITRPTFGHTSPVYITHEQADYLADLLKDTPIASVGNNVYEKCRKRGLNQPAFVYDEWR